MPALRGIDHFSGFASLEHSYDIFVAPVGFESRSRFISETACPPAKTMVACAFPDRHFLSFGKNFRWFNDSSFECVTVVDDDMESWIETLLTHKSTDGATLRVCVDISSLTRGRIAATIEACMRFRHSADLIVDFVYAVADWSPPDEDPEPIVKVGAIRPFFAGWSSSPEQPTVAVIGLGYEPDKAVGAYEYLEATAVWTFSPYGTHPAYEVAIESANYSLLEQVRPERRIRYRVDQPVSCFGALEAISFRAMNSARPVLLPFGPKIFAVCALLVACLHRDIPVWRVSSESLGKPIDRHASGQIVGLRAVFADRPSED